MKKKVFFVGVGGIGVSALAKFLYNEGYQIFGSNTGTNQNIIDLEKNFDLKFFNYHCEKNLPKDCDFLVYSPAVKEDNPERKKAERLNIKQYSLFEFLGKISKEKFTISVAGTNGKTTTTTMIAEILDSFQTPPMTFIGGISKKFATNFLYNKSENFLVESCEYTGSFLNLNPDIIIITNITPDHLDFFWNFENYKKVFCDFLDNYKKIRKEKILICNENDPNLKEVIQKAHKNNIKILDYKKSSVEKVSIPGKYNLENAQAAICLLDFLGFETGKSKKYLEKDFEGTERRFEYVGKKNEMKIFDDYAHNPEGLKSLRNGLDEKYSGRKKILVFQPHLFSRTQDFFNGFVEEISKYDQIFILPIYKAREKESDFSVTSEKLFGEIKKKNAKTFFCRDFDDCIKKIEQKKYDKNFVLVTAGAGDVYEIGKNLFG